MTPIPIKRFQILHFVRLTDALSAFLLFFFTFVPTVYKSCCYIRNYFHVTLLSHPFENIQKKSWFLPNLELTFVHVEFVVGQ